jgi:hypothetical protein
VVLTPAVDIEQVDKVFPPLIERLQVSRNLFTGGELFVIRVDLIFHPAQVLDCLALARIECLDHGFALRFAKLPRAFFFATLNQTAIDWTSGYDRQIHSFRAQREQQRRHVLKKSGADGKAGHAPKVNRLFECLFYVAKIDLGKFHEAA